MLYLVSQHHHLFPFFCPFFLLLPLIINHYGFVSLVSLMMTAFQMDLLFTHLLEVVVHPQFGFERSAERRLHKVLQNDMAPQQKCILRCSKYRDQAAMPTESFCQQ